MRRVLPYAIVVALSWAGSVIWSEQAENTAREETNRSVTTNYWNGVDACIRGNETARGPLHTWFKAFVRDERDEKDDAALLNVAQNIRGKFVRSRCLQVVVRPEGADRYVPVEER